MNKRGLTLVESLISVFLLTVLVIGVIGALYISRLGAEHAKHRMAAMNIARSYLEYELAACSAEFFDEGIDDVNAVDGFAHPGIASGDPVSVTIDDRNTADTADDLIGTLTPEPYYPYNLYSDAEAEQPLYYPSSGYSYKIIGFVVNWNEDFAGPGIGLPCRERVAVYVARHISS